MAGHLGVIIFLTAVAVLLLMWLFSWLTSSSYPTHICMLCGRRYHGHRALELARACEHTHLHGGDKP